MSNQNGYIGRSPGDSAVIIASQTFEPTGIQTDFTFASGYDPGYIDVYFNGARLVYANDYTATNGSTVGLTTYANNGDVLELVAYKAFNVANDTTVPCANFSGVLLQSFPQGVEKFCGILADTCACIICT